MKHLLPVCGMTAAMLSSAAAWAAGDVPATQPALPGPYLFLQSRSPFAHHGGGASDKGAAGLNGAGPTTAPGGTGGPDAVWVFDGVAQAGGSFTAFIENGTTHEIKQAGVGEAIGSGRITGVDLDTLQFTPAEQSARTIQVGENLEGQTPPPPKPATPAGGDGASPAIGAAAGGPPHPGPGRPGQNAPPGQVIVTPQ